MEKLAIVLGTRPEIIKCAPVFRAARGSSRLAPEIVATGQHAEMAEEAFTALELVPTANLRLMRPGQLPELFLPRAIEALTALFRKQAYRAVLVQGDTTSALAAALTAFHLKIPVIHLEAGLRSFDLAAPFPEEMNRTVISRMSALHLAPTSGAAANLASERVPGEIVVTGNTVVDSLLWMKEALGTGTAKVDPSVDALIRRDVPYVLVTAHRRENFDGPLESLCSLLSRLIDENSIEVIFPVHLNPKVQEVVRSRLGSQPRIHLIPPVQYSSALALLMHSQFVITDSGGIQEEAPSFGKRVFVARSVTERPEGVDAGFAELIDLTDIEGTLQRVLKEIRSPRDMSGVLNPYGDGRAAERAIAAIERLLQAC